MAEVKAQTRRIDHRTGLLHMDAQNGAQRRVQQVRRRVVAARGGAQIRAHLAAQNIAFANGGNGGDLVNGQPRHGRIGGLHGSHGLAGARLQFSAITRLAAGLGVKA